MLQFGELAFSLIRSRVRTYVEYGTYSYLIVQRQAKNAL